MGFGSYNVEDFLQRTVWEYREDIFVSSPLELSEPILLKLGACAAGEALEVNLCLGSEKPPRIHQFARAAKQNTTDWVA